MMKRFTSMLLGSLLVSLFSTNAIGQGVYLSASAQELAYVGKVYKGMNGSPFLYEDWTGGKVTLSDGATFEGLKLMYDLVEDQLIFNIEGNKAQKFLHPVKEFVLVGPEGSGAGAPRLFRNGFPAVDGSHDKNFYEVLVDGPTQLVKRTSKAIVEERAPNARVATKQLQTTERFYLYKGGALIKVRKDKKSVLAALGDKSAEIEKYLQSRKANLKDEGQLKELVVFYNTL